MESSHFLGLKVMRLTKPSLMTTVPVMGEPWDMLGKTLEGEYCRDTRTLTGLPEFSTSDVLALPQNFGMIFLGETFSGFVTVHNDSKDLVKEVVLKVDLLTPSQRVNLLTSPIIPQIDGGACEERIITHEVKELGEHSLVCSANYTVLSTGEELFLRKFFKFNVNKPLDVKTKFINIEDDIVLEVQLQNITINPMFLEVVKFDPAVGFSATDLNTFKTPEEEDSSAETVFGKERYIVPRNTRQYLYRITPAKNHQIPGKHNSVPVGKMDIVWRSKFGDRGRIQTGQLKANVNPLPDLKCVLVSAPGIVQLQQTFQVTCLITNTTNCPMRLRSTLERPSGAGLLFSGTVGQMHSELPGNSSMEMKLSVIPITPGIHSVGPISFVDLLSSQKTYQFTKLGQVFVEHTPTSVCL